MPPIYHKGKKFASKAAKAVLKQVWRIVRGDTVYIRAGKDAGDVGVVTKVIRDPNYPAVIVQGKNLKKKHVKKSEQNPEGGILTIEGKIHYAKVALVDPVNGAPVRSSYRYLEDGTKVRVSVGLKASGSVIPFPESKKEHRRPRPVGDGPKDTPKDEALKVTYDPGEVWANIVGGGGAKAEGSV